MTARGRCGQCFRDPHGHRAVLVGDVDRVRLLVPLRVKFWFADKRALGQALVDVRRRHGVAEVCEAIPQRCFADLQAGHCVRAPEADGVVDASGQGEGEAR